MKVADILLKGEVFMEKERKINWLGLFIKIIIIFVFILIIIWLISKIALKVKVSDAFKNNINNMETVATNYFKDVDLPKEKGESLKITLKEMINKGLIVSNDKDSSVSCDSSKSYSKITRKKSNYIMSTTLKCGDEKDTITKKFSFEDCKNCTKTTKNEKKEKINKNNEAKSSNEIAKNNEEKENANQNADNASKTTGTTYYEYFKENISYTKWMKGNITGNNVENRYEYYRVANNTYYTLGVIKDKDFKEGNKVSYTIKLSSIPKNNYYFSSIKEVDYYNHSEENNYLANENNMINSYKYSIPNSIDKFSLTLNNFTYTLSPYYRKGNFYIDVEITIINTNGVKAYNDKKYNIYYVPLKLNMQFASDNIIDSIPDGDYETITYYRYVEKTRDVIWSSENYVEGYTKTGRSEIR